MFDIGGPEFILLVLLALLIFGPRKLPGLGRQAGALVAKLRLAVRDFQGQLEREVAFQEVKDAAKEVTDLGNQARTFARDLTKEVGPPPYADPSRSAFPASAPPSASPGDPAAESGEEPPSPAAGLAADPRPGQG